MTRVRCWPTKVIASWCAMLNPEPSTLAAWTRQRDNAQRLLNTALEKCDGKMANIALRAMQRAETAIHEREKRK